MTFPKKRGTDKGRIEAKFWRIVTANGKSLRKSARSTPGDHIQSN